ncbi:unnamed protein product, partial [Rotaria sp. Silwood2]
RKKQYTQQKRSPNNTNSNKYSQTRTVSSITPQQLLSNGTRNSQTS